MKGQIWAAIWLAIGISWLGGEWVWIRNAPVDGIYGHETFYIVFEIVVAIGIGIPGLISLLVGAFKLAREVRKRNPH